MGTCVALNGHTGFWAVPPCCGVGMDVLIIPAGLVSCGEAPPAWSIPSPARESRPPCVVVPLPEKRSPRSLA